MNTVALGTRSVFAAGRWAALAYYKGHKRFLTPLYFPLVDSRDLLLEMVRGKAETDPDFLAKYKGWRIAAFNIDDSVKVGGEG